MIEKKKKNTESAIENKRTSEKVTNIITSTLDQKLQYIFRTMFFLTL